MRVLRAILIVLPLLLLGTGEAEADAVVSGNGTWTSCPSGSTGYCTPGGTWSFSFDLPNSLPAADVIQMMPGSLISSTVLTGFNFSPSPSTLVDIVFWPSGSPNFGGMDFDFNDGHTVSLYGNEQFYQAILPSGGMTFADGTFSTPIDFQFSNFPTSSDPTGGGVGTGKVTVDITSVPEPASLSLLGLGLFAAAAARKARSKRA
jgi:hypothetical protein